jgi:hypothetical protein
VRGEKGGHGSFVQWHLRVNSPELGGEVHPWLVENLFRPREEPVFLDSPILS